MECIYCRGMLERSRTSYMITRNGYHLIIDHVPAWICKQCGEALFEPRNLRKTVDELQVRLYAAA